MHRGTVKKNKLLFLAHLGLWPETCILSMDSPSQMYRHYFFFHSWIADKSDFVIRRNVDPL